MTEQERYYKKEYEEEYYIFDSNTLTEKEFEKKVEYEGYDLFADSLTPHEVLDLLNENEELKERVKQLQIDNTVLNKRYWALISENEDLNTSKEYWREKCLSKDSYNKFHHKPQVWFTQELKLTNKQANEIAEAINQSLKERRIKK